MVEQEPDRKPPLPGPQTADVAGPVVPASPRPHRPSLSSSTYVVQVPREQIYRVPPRENARLVEQYCNQDKTRRRSPCVACLKWILVAALLLLALSVVVVIVFFAAARPGTPAFAVQRLSVKSPRKAGGSHPKPEYDFTMSVRNPSQGTGFAYEAGGRAVVAHDSAEIAVGTTPGFQQGHQNTTTFKLVLHGSNGLLPRAIDRSLKGSKDVVHLELMAKFTVNPRVGGMGLGEMSMDVTCDIKVIGLVKDARISSQHCKTMLHL